MGAVLLLCAISIGCSSGPVRNVAYDPFVPNRSVRIVESGAVAYQGRCYKRTKRRLPAIRRFSFTSASRRAGFARLQQRVGTAHLATA